MEMTKTKYALIVLAAILPLATISVYNNALASTVGQYAGGTGTTTTVKVQAGGGNATNMLAAFVPQQVQVSVGQR